jgi:hypothetical protein
MRLTGAELAGRDAECRAIQELITLGGRDDSALPPADVGGQRGGTRQVAVASPLSGVLEVAGHVSDSPATRQPLTTQPHSEVI